MTRFLRTTVLLALTICSSAALFNYLADPYSIYQYTGANADQLSRVEQFYHMRLSKPWQVAQLKPNAVIVGTSRSGSMRPEHSSWSEDTGYNLSIPGMTPYELLRFVHHAQANGPLDKLMLGLDFEAFINSEPHSRAGFAEFRLRREPGPVESLQSQLQLAVDLANTLFSMPALAQSLTATTGAARPGRRYYPDGSWEKTSATLTGRKGYLWVGRTYRERSVDLKANMDQLAELLSFCHQQGIETRLFVTPEHVFLLKLWQQIGYAELWQEFHRQLVAVNEIVAETEGKPAFPLWGFNQLAGVVDEPILPRAKSRESNFLDGIHFRNQLATTIMDSAWSDSPVAGVNIDSKNLEDYLTQVQELTAAFEQRYPRLNAELREEIGSPER